MLSLSDEKKYDDLEKKYLLVEISGNLYAFSITLIKEVIPVIEIYSIDSGGNTVGVINLRGESVPVVDLKNFLYNEPTNINAKQKLIILQLNAGKLAIIADRLDDIIELEETNFTKLPSNGDFLSRTISDGRTVAVIDSYKFYSFFVNSAVFLQSCSTNLIPIETFSVDAIKKHTEIINQQNTYPLSDDVFLNEKCIIFRLNNEIYAFNILYIEMINTINSSEISRIPCVPKFIKGIINVKGDYLSLLDIKPFLNLENNSTDSKMEIVIIKVNSLRLAIIVDEIITIDRLPIPQMVSAEHKDDSFIKGEITSDGKLINMLDVEKLFSSQNVDIENYEIE